MKKLIAVLMSLSLIMSPLPAQASGDKPGGSAFYMNQILSIATGVVGTTLMLSCKQGAVTPSIGIAFAGSLVYIASEIMGGKAQKAFLQAKTKEVEQLQKTMQEGGDLQRESIVAMLEQEKEKRDHAKKRKTWMMAITAIYTIATIAAMVESACVSSVIATSTCANWISAMCISGTAAATSKLKVLAITGAYTYGVSNASGGGMGGIATMGATLLAATFASDATVSLTMGTPFARAVSFAVATALSMGVVAGLASTEKKLSENVSKLEKMLADFKEKTRDDNGMSEGTLAEKNYNEEGKKAQVKALPKVQKVARMCWGNSSAGPDYSEGSCRNPMRLERPRFQANLNMPNLTAMANTATDMGQAVADGNTDRADVLAGELAAGAGRMTQLRDNVMKQLNEQLKASGQKPLDLDAAAKKQLADWKADVNKRMSSQGMQPLADSGEQATLDPEKVADSEGPTGEVKGDNAAVAATPSLKDMKLDEGTLTDDMNLEAAGTGTGSLAEGLEAFETNESDITKKPEESIFKLLSNRYLLNYSRFFEKKRVEEAPAGQP